MIIGIDGRYAEGDLVGVGKYIKYLVEGLSERDLKIIIFYSKEPKYPIKHKFVQKVIIKTNNRYIFEQVLLPLEFRKNRIDMYHAVGNVGVPLLTSVPSVLTIHDLIPLTEKNYFSESIFPIISKLSYFFRAWTSALKSKRIIAVSNFTKSQIENILKINHEKIEVIYSGIALAKPAKFLPVGLKKNEYILNNGGMGRRKNLKKLLGSFKIVAKKYPNIKLVITGQEKNMREELDKLVIKYNIKNKVMFTGYVSESEMSRLVNSSLVICYPSLFEGFGFPILEGFLAGVPVITSNNSGMAEIAGNAALKIDPNRVSSIQNGMERLIRNRDLGLNLIKRGSKRVKKFDWSETAKNTLEIYNS